MIINKSEVDDNRGCVVEDRPTSIHDINIGKQNTDCNNKEKYIEECVSSLTKDHSFTVALAEAVARSMKMFGTLT